MSTHGCISIPCTICGSGASDARSLREERDHYRELTHTLGERIAHMTSAAQSAADTAVTAIERIQFLQDVVDAAVEWRKTIGNVTTDAERALWRMVDDYRLAVAERS